MALNPNIALGIQPVQQPNMLGMATQAMALKAAQQDIQGNEQLRAAYAQGGDLNDPEFRRRVMAANPKLGSELIKRNAETGKLQNEAIAKRIELSREMLTGVNTPEDYIAWHESNHKDPILGGYLGQRGITAEQSRAKIIAELSKPGGLEKLKRESSLGAAKLQQELMATERTRISAGPGYMQAQLAREKFDFEKANPGFEYKTLDNGNIVAVNKRTNEVSLLRGPGATPPPPAALPPAAANMLITPSVASPSVNALTQPTPNQAGPTVAAANALAANAPLRAAPRPGYEYNAQGQQVPIMDPTKVVSTVTDKFGNVSMLNAAGEVIKKVEGMGKPSAGVEKQQEKEIVTKEGKESVNRVLGTLYSEYKSLVETGGITDTRKSVMDNITARTGASAAGQVAGSYAGTPQQSFRDAIEQTRPLLLTAIMKATGLSATQLNSNVELQTYLKTATDPQVSIQSNVKALNNISKMFGLGEEFKVPEVQKSTSTDRNASSATNSAVVTTPDGRTIVFPDANAAARFKKEAGIK